MADGSTPRVSKARRDAVAKDSDEWEFMEFMLQIHTRTSRVKLIEAWHVAPPHIANQFERRTAVSRIIR